MNKQEVMVNAKRIIQEAKKKREAILKIEAELNATEKVLQEQKNKLMEVMKDKNINISIDEIPIYVDKLLDKVVKMANELEESVKQIDILLKEKG